MQSLIATSLHTKEEAERNWGAKEALDWLALPSCENRPSVEVLHGIDGTCLHETPLAGRRFERIVFMFPHCGKKGRIDLNRKLLRDFFVSAAPFLQSGGQVT
jgi:hypothetical protein